MRQNRAILVKTSNCVVSVIWVCNTIAYRRDSFVSMHVSCLYVSSSRLNILYKHMRYWFPCRWIRAHGLKSSRIHHTMTILKRNAIYTVFTNSLVESWSRELHQFPWKQQFHSLYLHGKTGGTGKGGASAATRI